MSLSAAFSQTYFPNDVDAVFKHMYSFEMLTADSLIEDKLEETSHDVIWEILYANVAWTELISGYLEDEEWNKQFRSSLQRAKSSLKQKRGGISSDEDLFQYIIIHAFETRHELMHENYLSAASDLNTCIDQVTASFGREEEYEPLYLTSGLYHYFMAKAYEDYKILRPYLWMYPKGDKKVGLSYLYKISTSDDAFLRNESNYFLMRIYYDLEKDYNRAALHARYLLKHAPDNLLYRLYYVKILHAMGEDERFEAEKARFVQTAEQHRELSDFQRNYFIELLEEETSEESP